MTNQMLRGLKSYMDELQNEITGQYECTNSDYNLESELNSLLNHITGEEEYYLDNLYSII